MRIALGVEYNGSHFHGWQSQIKMATLQATVENALSKVADEPISVFCAGRTDAGVHATNQVIHFETKANRKLGAWIAGTNRYLPFTISVQWAEQVEESFHARFSALSRRYQYIILNQPARPALMSSCATWINYPLEPIHMHAAIQYLLGEHDFTSFRSASCQSKTPKRHLFAASVQKQGSFILIDLVANSFLHHMVRNIVGTLLEIGASRQKVTWCLELLEERNRSIAAKTASPHGLYLTGVRYPDCYSLPYYFKPPSWLG